MEAKSITWFLTLLLSFVVSSGCAQYNVKPDPFIPEGIQVLADVKSQSEQWTRTLKKDYPRGTPEYKKAEALYIPAKAAIDGWIAALKADLTINGGGVAPQYQESLKQAAAKGHEYVVYVNQLYVKGAAAQALPLIGDLLKLLPDMGFKIWKEYRDAASKKEEDKKKKIMDQLETLKWEFFDKI